MPFCTLLRKLSPTKPTHSKAVKAKIVKERLEKKIWSACKMKLNYKIEMTRGPKCPKQMAMLKINKGS